MRRFNFTLESVLVVKQKKLEDERIKLAKIINTLNKQKEVLDELISNCKRIQNEADEYATGSNFNIEMITSFRLYSIKLNNEIKKQKEIIKKTSLDLTIQQNAANKAYIEVKTLEKLKEKQKEKYDREFLNEESKTLDDIVSSRHLKIAY